MSKNKKEQPRLCKKYHKQIVNELMKQFKLSNKFAVTRIDKVVLNMGITEPQDPRQRKQAISNYLEQLEVITGQKPVITVAKKAISTFKLRAGDPVGVMVTLRGRLMWEFLDKLISITLPRVKDFRGVSSKAFDGHGNYSLGLQEQIVFPEIDYDKIPTIKGLQINIVTSNESDKQSKALLKALGMPFEKEEKKSS